MTRKNSSTIKNKLLIIFTIICMFCSSLFLFTACKKKDVVDPTYTYSENSSSNSSSSSSSKTEDKTNYSFKLDDSTASFPVTSAEGFSRGTDNSAKTSAVNSGIISTTDDGFKSVITSLYADDDFVNYVANSFKIPSTENKATKSNITSALNTAGNNDVTTGDIAKYIIDNNIYPNPSTHEGAEDDFVYMLNNIREKASFGLGTAQKLYFSSAKTLEKGKTYELSVYVKTFNLSVPSGKDYGASIRLSNTLNNTAQSEYQINNINTNGDWHKYSIYVTADNTYESKINLILGLGYGDGDAKDSTYYVEGTVYFDDITFKEVEATEIPAGATENVINYGSEDKIENLSANNSENNYSFNMNYEEGVSFSTAIAVSEFTYTESQISLGETPITSKTYNDNSKCVFTQPDGTYNYELTQASISFDIKNLTNPFEVLEKEYIYLTFLYKNQLDKSGSTAVTVNIHDINGDIEEVRKAVSTYSNYTEDWTKAELLIKNNFDFTRKFFVEIVVGPTDIASVEYNSDFASGTFAIKDIKFNKGNIENEEDSQKEAIYKLFSNIADSTTSLYAGNIADYTEVNEDEDETYALSVAPGNIGCISYEPTNVMNYAGITYEHKYVNSSYDTFEVNTRSGNKTSGSFAGLINTKYLSNYNDHVKTAIGDSLKDGVDYESDKNIQPIAIYNDSADSYGYIGTQKTLSANAYAKVTVSLKVVGDAKAYVYIVNTANKQIMQFTDFTVNTDYGTVGNGTVIKAQDKLLYLSFEDTDSKWVTCSFFIANGKNTKNFRVEVWNGSRDGATKSQGLVLVKGISVSTSSAFTEPETWNNAFSTAGNPLFDIKRANITESIVYKRALTSTEEKFNEEYPNQAVNYSASYVWAKSDNAIYAVYNSIEVNEVDPYEISPKMTKRNKVVLLALSNLDSGCNSHLSF
ncbi:MAG: hypothetical protein MJ066_01000 [Clostridia bacterium]|nr:hypothetical protein [Clostridia bacterium]